MNGNSFDCITTGRVVINGDDYGMSPGINTAVQRLHQAGRMSSVSIMTNMPWSGAALAYAGQAAELRAGVHLNLTTGRPVLPATEVPTLVDQEERFLAIGVLLRRLLAGRVERAEIRRELQAQIELALDAGLDIEHLDSHMHFHSVPLLARMVTDLAHDNGIAAVRNPDFGAFVTPPPSEIGPVMNALTKAGTAVIASTQKAFTPKGFLTDSVPGATRQLMYLRYCLEPGSNPPAETFRSCLEVMAAGSLEIIAHPAEIDDVLPTLTGYVDGRQMELEFLAGDAFGQMLAEL